MKSDLSKVLFQNTLCCHQWSVRLEHQLGQHQQLCNQTSWYRQTRGLLEDSFMQLNLEQTSRYYFGSRFGISIYFLPGITDCKHCWFSHWVLSCSSQHSQQQIHSTLRTQPVNNSSRKKKKKKQQPKSVQLMSVSAHPTLVQFCLFS